MPRASIALLEIDPDLARFLTPEEREAAGRLQAPSVELSPGEVELHDLLSDRHAFGAVIVDGMLLQRFAVAVADATTMTPHGPGDLIGAAAGPGSMLLSPAVWAAAAPTRVALLDGIFLTYARRWPGLVAGLYSRGLEQTERATVQLAIAHLPRVEDRLLSVLWWLAETWGRVTASGTLLPIGLTHDGFGALVGARRSTVTLALGQLTERGAILHVDQGWLLLERPPAAPSAPGQIDPPSILDEADTGWRAAPDTVIDPADRTALHDTVRRLQAEHAETQRQTSARLQSLQRRRLEMADQQATWRAARRRVTRPAEPARRPPPAP